MATWGRQSEGRGPRRETERDIPTNRQTNTERETDMKRSGGRYVVTTKRRVRTRDIKS